MTRTKALHWRDLPAPVLSAHCAMARVMARAATSLSNWRWAECQRMRRDHRAMAQEREDRRRRSLPMQSLSGVMVPSYPSSGRREQRRGTGRRVSSRSPASSSHRRAASHRALPFQPPFQSRYARRARR